MFFWSQNPVFLRFMNQIVKKMLKGPKDVVIKIEQAF